MYKIIATDNFKKDVKKLDSSSRKLLYRWILKHLVNCENPKDFGKPLSGNLKGLWRYRIGNYRLIVQISEKRLIIYALHYGLRNSIYK